MRARFVAALAALIAVSVGSAGAAQEMRPPSEMTLEQIQAATIKNLGVLNAFQRELLRRDPASTPFQGYDPDNIGVSPEQERQIRGWSDAQIAEYMMAGAARIEALAAEGHRRSAAGRNGNDRPSAAASTGRAVIPGEYACTHDYWTGAGPYRQRHSDPVGTITIAADGSYRWLSNGGGGRWAHDAATGGLSFSSGPIADKQPSEASYRLNQRTSQIDISFGDGVDWSCGHAL
jgi:hypothetical protein